MALASSPKKAQNGANQKFQEAAMASASAVSAQRIFRPAQLYASVIFLAIGFASVAWTRLGLAIIRSLSDEFDLGTRNAGGGSPPRRRARRRAPPAALIDVAALGPPGLVARIAGNW